ncbi:MAG: FHA domain-containing protein [Spartobacteria bacterium]|nr:FHA domain-containing protein [Spartobacteria bacterium]
MHLRYVNKLGISKDIELTGDPLSIGRSREADIPLLDDKVSRVHCGIRLSDGEFYLKDLKSRNGVFVNGQRVEDTAKLKPGDRIQVGSTVFVLESATEKEDSAKGLAAVQGAMNDGKGYTTILKEIVDDIEPAAAENKPAAEEKPAPKPAGRPAIKISSPTIKVSSQAKTDPAGDDKPAPGKIRITLKK